MSHFSAVVDPQRLENVLGNKIGETQLENTQIIGTFFYHPLLRGPEK